MYSPCYLFERHMRDPNIHICRVWNWSTLSNQEWSIRKTYWSVICIYLLKFAWLRKVGQLKVMEPILVDYGLRGVCFWTAGTL